jgi:hypothetical protein
VARQKARVNPGTTAPPTALPGASPPELQELWFATLRRPWSRLALVPAAPETSVLALAHALAAVGGVGRSQPPRVLEAIGLGLAEIAEVVRDLEAEAQRAAAPSASWSLSSPGADGGSRVIVALDSIVANPLATAVALSCDAVVLCLEYGVSDLRSAERTIEQIGRERFVGSLLLSR